MPNTRTVDFQSDINNAPATFGPTGGSTQVNWRATIARHQRSSTRRAVWQLLNTGIPYLAVWYAMYLLVDVSYWLALPLTVLAGALLVRIFIIFHDCCHGSFFGARWANHLTGFLTGILTFTPYFHWRSQHEAHHRTAGRLDRRGTGDIWTLTVREYRDASRGRRLLYRIARNPLVLFAVAPPLYFVFGQRLPDSSAGPRERRSVWWMNLAVATQLAVMAWLFGATSYLLLQGAVMTISGAAGIWLFYTQHQFEDTYWERSPEWDHVSAAMRGSSFYKLPGVLQWLSGNIGFHHIHHLSPAVPNYNLQRCHEAHPFFGQVKPLTLLSSLRGATLHLWDEQARKLISFSQARAGCAGRVPRV